MRVPVVLRSIVLGISLTAIHAITAQNMRGSVSGLVVCNDTNAPARGARVELIPIDRVLPQATDSGGKSIPLSTSTDFNGAYELGSVEPGPYLVSATLDGYSNDVRLALSMLDRLSNRERSKLIAGLTEVTVKAGTDARKDLILRRLAAISGRVTVDTGGVPGRTQVVASRVRGEDSSTVPHNIEELTGSAALDDRGMYRIAGLPEGQYQLSIHISESHLGYKVANGGSIQIVPLGPGIEQLTVYAPEALDQADAKVFEVKDGDEITDADITIPTRLLHSIGGIVMERGAPRAGVEISFQRAGSPIEPHTAVSMSDGSFRLDLLTSGTYTLRAGLGEITVQLQDSDIVDATIDLHPTASPSRR